MDMDGFVGVARMGVVVGAVSPRSKSHPEISVETKSIIKKEVYCLV
jgi:hypothetical protein